MARVQYDQRGSVRYWVLWGDSEVRVITEKNPLWPAKFGGHIVVEQLALDPKRVKVPHENYKLFAKMNVIAAAVQGGLEETSVADHANIQCNGNWAFRSSGGSLRRSCVGGQGYRRLHIHIFGRRKEDPNWGNPISLPTYQARGTYKGQCLNEASRDALCAFLETEISKALQEVSL